MIYASETWAQVESEFDELGRLSFAECNTSSGKRTYAPDYDVLRAMDKDGSLHVTTARDDGKLVGYILSVVTKRHIQYNASVSQVLSMYLLPEHRKGRNGIKLMKCDEQNMRRLGVEEMNGGFTISKDLFTLFKREGWKPMETVYTKWLV